MIDSEGPGSGSAWQALGPGAASASEFKLARPVCRGSSADACRCYTGCKLKYYNLKTLEPHSWYNLN
eukprot:1703232-Rhodomonas_salina.1